jgi:hypothetical protein
LIPGPVTGPRPGGWETLYIDDQYGGQRRLARRGYRGYQKTVRNRRVEKVGIKLEKLGKKIGEVGDLNWAVMT